MSAPSRTVLALASVLLLASTCRPTPEPPPPVVEAPDDLGQRAYEHVAKLVSFGERHPGTPGAKRGIAYMIEVLRGMGLEPETDTWTDQLEGIRFTNVSVRIPGKSKDKIVLGCHHDTKNCRVDETHDFAFVGANDSGSGVGLLLELARAILAREDRHATYEVVFFDGEESVTWSWDIKRALFGSRRYVRRHQQHLLDDPDAPQIHAFVLLDMVGSKDLHIDNETNSDRELRDVFFAAARATGHERYFYEHELAVTDDHIPFVEARIRAIDLIDFEDNPQWHTPQDTLEHISARSLQVVGEVVLTALPVIEERFFPDKKR